jgi:hypothetical protein
VPHEITILHAAQSRWNMEALIELRTAWRDDNGVFSVRVMDAIGAMPFRAGRQGQPHSFCRHR